MFRSRFAQLGGALVALLVALQACRPHAQGIESPQELPKDTHFHALPQTQLGIYAVLLPPDYDAPQNREKTYPLVLIIHGHGSTEVRHGKMADTFGRQDAIYLAPRAPYPHERVFIELDTDQSATCSSRRPSSMSAPAPTGDSAASWPPNRSMADSVTHRPTPSRPRSHETQAWL